jgi:hypothetical protein
MEETFNLYSVKYLGVIFHKKVTWRLNTEMIEAKAYANVRNTGQGEPNTGNIRGLNLAAVKHTTVQVTRLLLQQELLMLGHDLLY